jgi:quercetin dioxygenase-like cupin family protein
MRYCRLLGERPCLLDIDILVTVIHYTALFIVIEGERMAQAVEAPTQVKVVQPGDGDTGMLLPGVGVTFKIDAEDVGGRVAVVEHPFAVGALVPPHVHHLEDEISIVLEGSIGFRSEDKEAVLSPGGYIVKPRGEVHAMWNAGDVPARMIEIITPAGFDKFFRDVARLNAEGNPTPPDLMELAAQYELPFVQPDWMGEIIERYGLNPPF